MRFYLFAAFLLMLMLDVTRAQDLPPIWATSDYARPHEGLTSPKLLHSKDPEYTPQARAAGIEGSVVLQVVIDKEGRAAYASVLSPLPAGLDRKALTAIKEWRFTPGVVDGEIVPVLMTVDVLFKLPYKSAVAGNDASALCERGQMELQKNEAHGWQLLRRAAFYGSTKAQKALGERDEEAGNLNEAKWFFRLCAARGVAACEYRLGKLLVTGPDINPNDFAQGVAWLEVAKEHGDEDARKLYTESAAKLSSIQVDWVAAFKPHLELRGVHGF